MPIPLILGAAARMLPGVMGAVGVAVDKKKTRRRRRRLTPGMLQELAMVKATLGRTAAANALPYYLK